MGLSDNLPIWQSGMLRPKINWSFIGSIPSNLTFTRASTGTYFDAEGVLQTAAIDAPRFDHDPVAHQPLGLLYEGQRTNVLNYSNDFSQNWNSIRVVSESGFDDAPDGTPTFCKITRDSTSLPVYFNRRIGARSIGTYPFSVFAKKGSGYLKVRMQGDYPQLRDFSVNLDTGECTIIGTSGNVSGSCEIIKLKNNVWRVVCKLSVLFAQSDSVVIISCNSRSEAWADDTDSVATTHVYIWGTQYEEKQSFASSYIPTTTTAVTRAADSLTFTIPAGVTGLRFTFDDDSTQDVAVSAGAYTVPTNLNRTIIKRITSI